MYVAKNDKGKNPAISLINECLAYYFLSLWNLKVPNCSIMKIPKELIINEKLSNNHRIHYYDTPCFASKWVENALDVNDFILTQNRTTYNSLKNPFDFLHIALFDLWVENDDRKPTNYNLILEPDTKQYVIIPIDHAFIFSTLRYEHLNPIPFSPIANDHILVSDLGHLIKRHTKINQQVINIEKDYFYLCLNKCQDNFNEIVNQISLHYLLKEEDVNKIKEFLFNTERNTKVFEEYVYRLTHE